MAQVIAHDNARLVERFATVVLITVGYSRYARYDKAGHPVQKSVVTKALLLGGFADMEQQIRVRKHKEVHHGEEKDHRPQRNRDPIERQRYVPDPSFAHGEPAKDQRWQVVGHQYHGKHAYHSDRSQ